MDSYFDLAPHLLSSSQIDKILSSHPLKIETRYNLLHSHSAEQGLATWDYASSINSSYPHHQISPPLSNYPLSPQHLLVHGGHLLTHLFLTLLLLKKNERTSTLYFWHHQTPLQISVATEALDTALVQ